MIVDFDKSKQTENDLNPHEILERMKFILETHSQVTVADLFALCGSQPSIPEQAQKGWVNLDSALVTESNEFIHLHLPLERNLDNESPAQERSRQESLPG